jgi:P-type Ca2+ transporter type 2C
LAVTISLAFSTKKMYEDQCFIRILAACETMGNATNICSDKTGTLTENRMTVVEGWFADTVHSAKEFGSPSKPVPSEQIRAILAENCCINRQAYLVTKDEEGNELHRPSIIGNKTEGALILLARSWGFDYEQLTAERFHEDRGDRIFSFNSSKKRSTAIIQRRDGSVRLLCKV